jgi:hypothetical protein
MTLTRQREGAFSWALWRSSSNSGMPEAARVANGPGQALLFGAYLRALRARFGELIEDALALLCKEAKVNVFVAHNLENHPTSSGKTPIGALHRTGFARAAIWRRRS